MPVSLADIASLMPNAGRGNVEPMTGVGQGPLGAGGGMGGVLAAQNANIAAQQYGQLQQDQSIATQGAQLQLNQANADENTFGQQQRDLKASQTGSQLDLWKQGILGKLDKQKSLTALDTEELKQLQDNMQKQYVKGQASESIMDSLPKGSSSIPPAMMNSVKSYYKNISGDDLPEDPMEAYAQIQHDGNLHTVSGPRIENTIQHLQKLEQLRQTGKNEIATVQAQGQNQASNTAATTASAENIARIGADASITPARVLAQAEQEFGETNGKGMSPGKLALIQAQMYAAQNPAMAQASPMKILLMNQIQSDKTLSPAQMAASMAQLENSFRAIAVGAPGKMVQDAIDNTSTPAGGGSTNSSDTKPATMAEAAASWTDHTKTYPFGNSKYQWDSQRNGWAKVQ